MVLNTHGKGEQVKIPLLPNKVGKRSRTMVTTLMLGQDHLKTVQNGHQNGSNLEH